MALGVAERTADNGEGLHVHLATDRGGIVAETGVNDRVPQARPHAG